jgi:hypothetical protein
LAAIAPLEFEARIFTSNAILAYPHRNRLYEQFDGNPA